jgi:hypothetical protein
MSKGSMLRLGILNTYVVHTNFSPFSREGKTLDKAESNCKRKVCKFFRRPDGGSIGCVTNTIEAEVV